MTAVANQDEVRQAQPENAAGDRRFRDLFESAPDGIVIVDRAGRIELLNTQAERMFGYRRRELIGEPVEVLMPERFRTAHVARRDEYHAAPRTRPMGAGLELFGRRKDGSEFPVEISLSPAEDAVRVMSIIRDITERKHAEAALHESERRSREMAEQLKLSVREAHHRIKNNLQAISDLLHLELTAGRGGCPEEALRGSIERIQAIATVHDLLTQDDDVRVVDARAVLERLVPMVLRSNGVGPEAVAVKLSVGPVPLSSRRATALALIANELVSNAAKHAFKNGRNGELTLSLHQANDELVLRARDDGPGLPADFALATHAHVGLDVVRTLAERDLDGAFTLSSSGGVLAEVRFAW